MSRSTQYIGLNAKATKWLEYNKATIVEDKTHKTLGMFDENVSLSTYYVEGLGIVKEVVDIEPWSSGLMIFTCLRDKKGNKFCRWTLNVHTFGEYDRHSSTYYI